MNEDLALNGGSPVHTELLPYGRQFLGDDDVQAVVEVLRSDWLTTGPKVVEFERAFAEFVGAREAVATLAVRTNVSHAYHLYLEKIISYFCRYEPGEEQSYEKRDSNSQQDHW